MTDNTIEDDSSLEITDYELVSQWVERLSESPFLKMSDDGEVYLGIASELDRTVDTGPLDRLTITADKNYPRILSISEIDGKRKLLISIDSNLIPQAIDSLREKSKKIRSQINTIVLFILIISSATFVLEAAYGINFPKFLSPLRLIAFWLAIPLYFISERIALQGVAHGKPASLWGCTDCANVQMEQGQMGEEPDVSCNECEGNMVWLVRGGPGSVTTRGTQFEHMLKEELKRSQGEETDDGEVGIDRVKRGFDAFYEDEDIIALYCLALQERGDLRWSDEDQDVVWESGDIGAIATWGTRGEDGSDKSLIANSLKDALLAHAIIARAHEKDETDVGEQLDILADIINNL